MVVLDVACGPGYVAEAVRAAAAAPLGLDFSPAMVQRAHARNCEIRFVCGDAQALPFGPGSFDAVVMNFGLLHLARPEAALAEARRVLRPSGRYAFTVWAGPELSPGASIVDAAIRAHASADVELPAGPAYYGYSDPDDSRRTLHRCGFAPGSLRFRTVTAVWQVPTASFVFAAERDAGVRTAAVLAAQQPAVCAAIEAQMAAGFMPYRNATGFGVPYVAHVISATAA
jgi:SAM-dependent methyltransferase